MCRFTAYFGREDILLDELLAKPKNSLIKQSHEAREGTHGINADGFGVAWYNFDVSNYPGAFKSTQPAWNNKNLMHISQKIKSSCFLGHVRASTIGDVSQSNCHPFIFQEYAFVHNGTIENFNDYKKQIVYEIDKDLFLAIKGNTDSEYFFFLIMHFLRQDNNLETSVKKAINWIVNIQKADNKYSSINIVITNGVELVATRFSSSENKSLSLKYCYKEKDRKQIHALTISSEALDNHRMAWLEVPKNNYLYLHKDNMQISMKHL